jgi:hypothetical protein
MVKVLNWSRTLCLPKTPRPAAGAAVDEADSDSRTKTQIGQL